MKLWRNLPATLRKEGALDSKSTGTEHCMAIFLAPWAQSLHWAHHTEPFSLHVHPLPSLCNLLPSWQMPARQ